MSPAAAARRKVESALLYLDRRATLADSRNNSRRARDYRDAWRMLFEVFYGADENPQPRRAFQPVEVHSHVKTLPRWRAEILARPMRRVIATVRSTIPGDRKFAPVEMVGYKLECGHATAPALASLEVAPAHRRRCHACAERADTSWPDTSLPKPMQRVTAAPREAARVARASAQ